MLDMLCFQAVVKYLRAHLENGKIVIKRVRASRRTRDPHPWVSVERNRVQGVQGQYLGPRSVLSTMIYQNLVSCGVRACARLSISPLIASIIFASDEKISHS